MAAFVIHVPISSAKLAHRAWSGWRCSSVRQMRIASAVAAKAQFRGESSTAAPCAGCKQRRLCNTVPTEVAPRGSTAPLQAVRSSLDQRIVGHEAEKEAVLLALVAQEHVYIEGPPGVAKTMLAETAAQSTGLSFFFYQMHRDTKLHELIGDAVIMREPHAEGGEIVRSFTRPGGILTSELCVLDDISRAPGEALNVLLRLLNERQYCGPSSGGEAWDLPLRTAIATSNPSDPGSRYYTEPLDPANLDRFVLQLRTEGAISGGRWDEAAKIIDLFSEATAEVASSENPSIVVPAAADLQAASEAHARTVVPRPVRRLLLEVLQELVTKHGVTQKNSLLTDRTFLVKTLRVMRARAVLHGREECTPKDLSVLSYLTTFRIPEPVHRNIDDIIHDVLKRSGFSVEEVAHNGTEGFDRSTLESMSVRALRHECYLRGMDISRCFDKDELIDLLMNPKQQDDVHYSGMHDSH